MNDFISNTKNTEENNVREKYYIFRSLLWKDGFYLHPCNKKLKKADAQYYTINDALRLGFEKLNVTRVIVLSKEEAYSAFDMEQETPVFSPRFK